MGFLTDILAGLPLNALLRERIADAEKKHTETVDELGRCKEQCADLLKQLADYRQRDQHPQKDYKLDLPELAVLRKFDAAGRNTIELDCRDHVVSGLIQRGFLKPLEWSRQTDGPVSVQITPEGRSTSGFKTPE
jgi:hypothetical protein